MTPVREMYHTQEKRKVNLPYPIKCIKDNAWLGDGYYFWYDIQDAEKWGNDSKRRTGAYQIYKATINCENVLDTVFNEEHYLFWLAQVEKAATKFIKTTGKKPTLKQINDYFKERGQWDSVDGIMFQELPQNQNLLLVLSFHYRKRIQLVAYKLEIVNSFALKREVLCI
jgi:hypothetical protein